MDEQNQDNPTPTGGQQQHPQVSEPQWQYQSGNLAPSIGYDSPTAPAQPDQSPPPAVENQPPQPETATDTQPPQPDSALTTDSISWNASEFVSHEKTGGWYVYVVVGAIILAAIIYFVTKEIFSVAVIILVAIAFAVFGALKPRVLEYSINPEGINVGQKHFSYEEFRSFSVIDEGALPNIQLLPQKRFMVPITMYFEPADGDKIVNILGEYLPFEHHDRDLIDKITSKIHF